MGLDLAKLQAGFEKEDWAQMVGIYKMEQGYCYEEKKAELLIQEVEKKMERLGHLIQPLKDKSFYGC